MLPVQPPFSPSRPVRTLADVRQLERTPLHEAMPVHSTYELLRNSAHAFANKVALSFLTSANPDDAPPGVDLRRTARRRPPGRQPAAPPGRATG
jgi:hypothetical protein